MCRLRNCNILMHNISAWLFCLFVCLFVCLFSSHLIIFTQMETSLFPDRGCKFWPVLGTHGVKICSPCPGIMTSPFEWTNLNPHYPQLLCNKMVYKCLKCKMCLYFIHFVYSRIHIVWIKPSALMVMSG